MDTDNARNKMKAIHILAKHGGKWVPESRAQIDRTRRLLLKMKPDYTMEFSWIMSKYQACSRESVSYLLRTPSIRALVDDHAPRVEELLETLPA